MSQVKQIRIERKTNILDERAGYRISADWGHLAVVSGGGHICDLRLNSVPAVNPLWKPQWATIDPRRYLPGRHRRTYGPAPDGKLLASIAGHSLSFDYFGPPSRQETAAGLTTHGEAPCSRWKLLKTNDSSALRYGCTLQEAQIEFSRTISLDRSHPVIYCEEQAQNLSIYDRPISWNEHVTFGPPFLETGTTIFDMSATRAKVCSADYSDRNFLEPDAEFTWPKAPKKDGGFSDLRRAADGRFGHYTAQLLDPSLDLAFISACNPGQGLLVAYAFRRADFPWVGNWEERNNRDSSPWSGRTFCRGIEFSTTPFAIPRRETIDRGALFGERTYRWLPAKSSLSIRYLIMLFAVPANFGGVQRLEIDKGQAQLTEAGNLSRRLRLPVKPFLWPRK
jgi:hypothetical protein